MKKYITIAILLLLASSVKAQSRYITVVFGNGDTVKMTVMDAYRLWPDSATLLKASNDSIAGKMSKRDTSINVMSRFSAQQSIAAIQARIDSADNAITAKQASASLASVATSGSYSDLSNKPTIPAAIDTASLSNRINAKANTSSIPDTTSLSNRINSKQATIGYTPANNADTSLFIRKVDTVRQTAPITRYDVDSMRQRLNAGLNGKFTTPSGTALQYVRGDGTLATLPVTDSTIFQTKFGVDSMRRRLDANIVTPGTYNTVTVNAKGQVTSGQVATPAPTTVTLNSGAILSATQSTRVSYTVTNTVVLSALVLSGSSMAYLETSPNNSTWTTISQTGYSDAILIGGSLNKSVTGNIQGEVPANYYRRIRTVVAGGGSATYTCGQETPY